MAKGDRYVAASAGAGVATLGEEPDKDGEGTPAVEPTPDPTPTVDPATPAPEMEPAPAAEVDNRVELRIPMLISQNSEVKRVVELLESAERLSKALRSAIHFMIGAENARGSMPMGMQIYFTALANGTFDSEQLSAQAQDVLTGQVTLDNEGEVVVTSQG